MKIADGKLPRQTRKEKRMKNEQVNAGHYMISLEKYASSEAAKIFDFVKYLTMGYNDYYDYVDFDLEVSKSCSEEMGKKVIVFTARQYGIGVYIAEDRFGACGKNRILVELFTSFLETNKETIDEIISTLDDAEDCFRMIFLILCAFLAYYEDNSNRSVGKTA